MMFQIFNAGHQKSHYSVIFAFSLWLYLVFHLQQMFPCIFGGASLSKPLPTAAQVLADQYFLARDSSKRL